MSTTSYKRGDVLLALFPDSNQRTGKRRPVLVVEADHLATGLRQLIVAMISSNPTRRGHASRVEVSVATPDGQVTGLQLDSIIMTDNLATILHKSVDRVLGVWPRMDLVDAALRHTLGL